MKFSRKIILIGLTESVLTKRGNRFPNLADFLYSKGFKVLYISSNFYHAEKRHFSNNEIEEAKLKCPYPLYVFKTLGYKRNISPTRLISNFLYSLRILLYLFKNIKKDDLVLIPSRPVELIYVVSLIKRVKGCRIFLDIQDIWPDALKVNNTIKSKLFIFYCNFFLKRSLKYYTNTFHVAPSFFQWLRRYSKYTTSTFIPLGWENERWPDKNLVNSLRFQESTYRFRFVFVGKLTYQFDIMPFLEILNNDKDYFLTIIGEDGTGERYNEVMNYVEKFEIKNIKFTGTIPRQEMANHLLYEDIGIVPMISTSIPNKVFDYIAASIPILVLGHNDSSEFVLKYGMGWSCEFNSRSLKDILDKLTKQDFHLKEESVKKVRMNFSRDRIHEEILRLLEDVSIDSKVG
jgi:hypothetical protein